MQKIVITCTIPDFFKFFKDQLFFLTKYFQVTILSSQEENLKIVSEKEHVSYKYIHMVRQISFFTDIVSLAKFVKYFWEEKPDVVHGNTPKAGLLAMISAKITCVPKRIYMCHGLRYQSEKGLKRLILMFMERVSCYCATKVLCVSFGIQQTLIADKICKSSKIVVPHKGSVNGINLERFDRTKYDFSEVRSKHKIPEENFVFIFIGRVTKDKGINELVESFDLLCKKHDNINLFIIGEQEVELDPIDKKTQTILQSNPSIICTGVLQNVIPYILSSNALVLPSYREGLGMVLLEASALDVPCIATDIVGCNEAVEVGVNGELVKPRSVQSLYDKMDEWISNPQKVKQLSDTSRESIKERYNQIDVWNALLKEYQS